MSLFMMRISEEMKEELKKVAAKEERTMTSMVKFLIRNYLEQQNKTGEQE